MAWTPGSAVTGGALATNLQQLHIFGTDGPTSAENLVNNTVYTVVSATGTFGTDVLGSYYEADASGERLDVNMSTDSFDVVGVNSYFVTFTRRGTVPDWAPLFAWYNSGGGWLQALQRVSNTTNMRVWRNGTNPEVTYDLATGPAIDVEHTMVVTNDGTTTKVFYTGGSSAITLAQAGLSSDPSIYFSVAGWSSGEYYPGRFRALGRWTRTLSDVEAQSMADNPQQIMAATAPDAPATVNAGSITTTSAAALWSAVSGATGYKVQYSANPHSSWTNAGTFPTGAGVTSLAVTGLTSNTLYKFRVATVGAGGDSSYTEMATAFRTVDSTKLRPMQDITTGPWQASGGGALYLALDEVTPSTADSISTNSAGTFEVRLSSGLDPAVSYGHTVTYGFSYPTPATFTIHLVEGTTIRSTDPTPRSPGTTPTLYSWTLSPTEADSIGDYTNLRIRGVAS